MARSRAAMAAIVAGLLLVAAAGPPSVASPPSGAVPGAGVSEVPSEVPSGEVAAAIGRVLEERAAAVRDRDRRRFAATIDPLADPDEREAQLAGFEGFAVLDLADLTLSVRFDRTGDLTPPGLTASYGGAPVVVGETTRRWRLSGYDAVDRADTLWWTYVRRGDRWFVGGRDDLRAVGLDSAVNLWDLGPVATVGDGRILVIHHPGDADRAADLAALTREALEVFDGLWSHPWPGTVVVVVPSDAAEAARLLAATFDVEDFVAFVTYPTDPDDGWRAGAPRLIVQDTNLARRSHRAQVETLVHELVHVATAPHAGPFIDAWFHEGLADWVAGGRAAVAPPRGSDGHLPRPHELRTGGRQAIITAYGEARSAVAHLAALGGDEAPVAVFGDLGAITVAVGDRRHHMDRVLRARLGMSLAEFEEDWAP